MNTDSRLIEEIQKIFGNKTYEKGILNRKHLADIVFNNKTMLNKLNSIVHPATEKDYIKWCNYFSESKYTIKEAAILFESNAYKLVDKIIVVNAPVSLRISRVMSRDNVSKESVIERIKNQWPAEKLLALADFIIENNDKELILPQIIKIDKFLTQQWQNLENG